MIPTNPDRPGIFQEFPSKTEQRRPMPCEFFVLSPSGVIYVRPSDEATAKRATIMSQIISQSIKALPKSSNLQLIIGTCVVEAIIDGDITYVLAFGGSDQDDSSDWIADVPPCQIRAVLTSLYRHFAGNLGPSASVEEPVSVYAEKSTVYIDRFLQWMWTSPTSLIDAFESLPIHSTARPVLYETLRQIHTPSLVLSLLACRHRVVTSVLWPSAGTDDRRIYSIVPGLISNICPKWAVQPQHDMGSSFLYYDNGIEGGGIYVYSHCIAVDIYGLFIFKNINEADSVSSSVKQQATKLKNFSGVDAISAANTQCPLTIPLRVSNALGLIHMIYCDVESSQYFSSDFHMDIRHNEEQLRRCMTRYHACKHILRDSKLPAETSIVKDNITYLTKDKKFELYMTLPRHSNIKAQHIASLLEWVKSQRKIFFHIEGKPVRASLLSGILRA
eukprot:GHVO01046656.1.p1 GENE.GHVO01046656.1~~GHVO01046656.1.p1  ORF type:complete len:459 (-),score=47.65 GHVO01046656.1:205-1539(-)